MLSALFLASLVITNLGNQCVTGADEFAVEVVLPDYDLRGLFDIGESQGDYIYKDSEYNKDLLALYSQSDEGLSVRIQAPTEVKAVDENRYRIVSSNVGKVRRTPGQNFFGWNIKCDSQKCSFVKSGLKIDALLNGEEAELEISQKLDKCDDSCDGKCFSTSRDSLCINATLKNDIENVMRVYNISQNLEQFLRNSRIASSSGLTFVEIRPSVPVNISWSEAITEELRYIQNKKLAEISNDDISEIASLAGRGRAGKNYRIVRDGDWKYSNLVDNATLVNEPDCRVFTLQELPVDDGEPDKDILFYKVPLILTISGIIMLLILVTIARVANKRREKV